MQMAAPYRGSLTSETQIEVKWVALTTQSQIGGAPIVSYYLQWDQGSNGANWYDLTGLTSIYPFTSFVVTTNVVKGTTYQF